MCFSWWSGLTEDGSGGADGPCNGEGYDRREEGEFGGVGELGILEIQAAGFGVSEHGFDGPAFAIGVEGVVAQTVGGDGDGLAALWGDGGKVQRFGHAIEGRGDAAAFARDGYHG